MLLPSIRLVFFFFNDTATTEIYTLSLHDALPIYSFRAASRRKRPRQRRPAAVYRTAGARGRGCWRGRHFPGDPRQSRQSAFRRSQRPAAVGSPCAAHEIKGTQFGGAALEREMSLETARRVLRIEAQAIQDVLARLDDTFEKAVDVLFACKGRVVVTGMGKSGLIGRKISATLSSTGTPSFFLHAAEALHGDMGMLARGDALLAVSYGGETEEIIRLLEALKPLAIPMVTLTGKIHSTLAEASDVVQ